MATKTYRVFEALRDVYPRTHRKAVVSDQLPVVGKNPADVNGDGVVNVFDLVFVAGNTVTSKNPSEEVPKSYEAGLVAIKLNIY